MQRTLWALVLVLTWSSANASLIGRNLDGNAGTAEAYYDTVLNITWLADANLADTNTFAVTGIAANGSMTWAQANSWIAAMNTASYLGINNWRLPTTTQPDPSCGTQTPAGQGSGAGCAGSEMGHLGNVNNIGSIAEAPFFNVQGPYWSITTYALNTNSAWIYQFASLGGGSQNTRTKTFGATFAWAVTSGDRGSTVVPIAPAVWLFGSALGVMGWMRRNPA